MICIAVLFLLILSCSIFFVSFTHVIFFNVNVFLPYVFDALAQDEDEPALSPTSSLQLYSGRPPVPPGVRSAVSTSSFRRGKSPYRLHQQHGGAKSWSVADDSRTMTGSFYSQTWQSLGSYSQDSFSHAHSRNPIYSGLVRSAASYGAWCRVLTFNRTQIFQRRIGLKFLCLETSLKC